MVKAIAPAENLCFDFSQALPPRVDGSSAISVLAKTARQSPTPLEDRFMREGRRRWPGLRWRRYYPIALKVIPAFAASVWYAPFYSHANRLVICIEERPAFPYTISGQQDWLYAEHGFTVLDFTEDFLGNPEESVWQEAMGMVGARLGKAEG